VSWLGMPTGPAGLVGAVAATVVLAALLVGLGLYRLVRRPTGEPLSRMQQAKPCVCVTCGADYDAVAGGQQAESETRMFARFLPGPYLKAKGPDGMSLRAFVFNLFSGGRDHTLTEKSPLLLLPEARDKTSFLRVKMAGHRVPLLQFQHWGFFPLATIDLPGAPGVESATRRWRYR
jgi:hypothetical protein